MLRHIPLLVSAVVWGCLLQWPWGAVLVPALGILVVVHLAAPVWSVAFAGGRVPHRVFLTGPLTLFLIDAMALVAAWRADAWGDLTTVFVPILAVASVVALAYSATVMTVFSRHRE